MNKIFGSHVGFPVKGCACKKAANCIRDEFGEGHWQGVPGADDHLQSGSGNSVRNRARAQAGAIGVVAAVQPCPTFITSTSPPIDLISH